MVTGFAEIITAIRSVSGNRCEPSIVATEILDERALFVSQQGQHFHRLSNVQDYFSPSLSTWVASMTTRVRSIRSSMLS